jgi:hypothetical protein
MATILALEPETSDTLRRVLVDPTVVRPNDECYLLPQAETSVDTRRFKNAVFVLNGATPSVPSSVFSEDWFTGLSAVRLKRDDARRVQRETEEPNGRERLLAKLRACVSASTAEVGPPLDGDGSSERDRRDESWECGFDSSTCCVGFYTCTQSCDQGDRPGTSRAMDSVWLVCRAGGGQAASVFHKRLVHALSKGHTLTEVLESDEVEGLGPLAVSRVAAAGRRNRARVMYAVARDFGLSGCTSTPDHLAHGKHRVVVPHVDTAVNTIVSVDAVEKRASDADRPRRYVYATCACATMCHGGMVACSNVADGFVLYQFHEPVDGDVPAAVSLENDVHGCLPFASERLCSSTDLCTVETTRIASGERRVDDEWIRKRFTWSNRQVGGSLGVASSQVTPFGLVGSHAKERWTTRYAHELGVLSMSPMRLRPDVVLLAGVETARLRSVCRAVAWSKRALSKAGAEGGDSGEDDGGRAAGSERATSAAPRRPRSPTASPKRAERDEEDRRDEEDEEDESKSDEEEDRAEKEDRAEEDRAEEDREEDREESGDESQESREAFFRDEE